MAILAGGPFEGPGPRGVRFLRLSAPYGAGHRLQRRRMAARLVRPERCRADLRHDLDPCPGVCDRAVELRHADDEQRHDPDPSRTRGIGADERGKHRGRHAPGPAAVADAGDDVCVDLDCAVELPRVDPPGGVGDPTCSFSRSAAARLGRAALDGRLQLRVVPVAVLGADAARLAVAIAAHPDPAAAWFEGGDAAVRTLVPETLVPGTLAPKTGAERIARNNALFDEWGASAVPLIAWRTRDPRAGDGAVGHRIGDIDDVGAWLRETLGPDTLGVGDTRAGDTRARDPQDGRRP